MERLKESIRQSGVLIPALARPTESGYELISGHRRLAACRALGMSTMPVIVRNLTDEEADSNLQREHILPSEKAFAYKMKMEALIHQGKTSRQLGEKWSVSQISEAVNDSERQIHRYIRLDHIDVYETEGIGKSRVQRVVIYYKFVGYLDIDPTQCRPNYTADIREGVAMEYVSCEPSENLKELFPEEYGVEDDIFEDEETEQA